MSRIVNILVDASGSMAEEDKNAVVKYLLNGICNVSDLSDFDDVSFQLFQWGKVCKRIEDIENAKIEFSGKAQKNGLEELAQIIDESRPLLFISDGGFEKEDRANLRKISENIVPIFIGIDANRTSLQEISSSGIVYSVADFVQAIYEACIQ